MATAVLSNVLPIIIETRPHLKHPFHEELLTFHTLILPSVYPAYRSEPLGDQQRQVQYGICAVALCTGNSGRSSSTSTLFSRSHIFMPCVVAAQSQYLLGENTREWMMSPASKLYKDLPSTRSHSIAVPSFPPDAQRDPSGEIVTVLR